MISIRISIIAILGVMLSNNGCGRQESNYCAETTHHNCLDVDIPDANKGCTSDENCPDVTARACDIATGTCVQCTMSNLMACGSMTPVCDSTHTCVACTTHSQCSSNVCSLEHSCIAEEKVAYVTENSFGTDCTRIAPCGGLQDAFLLNRDFDYIKVSSGSIITKGATINRNVTILADSGARLIRESTGNGPVLNINSANSVAIYDLEIIGAIDSDGILVSGNSSINLKLVRVSADLNKVGIHLTNGNGNIHLEESSIGNNETFGIDMENGTLSIDRTMIFNNKNIGIMMNAGALSIDRTTVNNNDDIGIKVILTANNKNFSLTRSSIFSNKTGGVNIYGTGIFTITNNFIYRNGDSTISSSFGGLSLGNLTGSPQISGILRFNTIVDNFASTSSSTMASGIICGSVNISALNAKDNIIFRNRRGNSDYNSQVADSAFCIIKNSNSLIITDSPALPDPPNLYFRSEQIPYDYHLTDMSPRTGMYQVIDYDQQCGNMEVDFDGDSRPIGEGCDRGADEWRR